MLLSLADIPFLQARHYMRGQRERPRNVVIHCMEAIETNKTAENVAKWWNGTGKNSCHFCVDNDSTIQCVKLGDTAYHAKGANDFSIGVELAGYAKQTEQEWLDAYGKAMLPRAAELVACLLDHYDLPAVLVDQAGLEGMAPGVTTHAAVSGTFHGNHYDPGKRFPMAFFMDQVRYFHQRYREGIYDEETKH